MTRAIDDFDSTPLSREGAEPDTQRVRLRGKSSRASRPTDQRKSVLQLPEVGEEVFGFRLRGELGRGAFARVFLAEQARLAGRPVALKVSAIDGDEPQTLAQLQHTNIVPIYSVHEDQRAGLRLLCMPYFGGASLSEVLRKAWHGRTSPNSGADLIRALSAAVDEKLGDDAAAERSKIHQKQTTLNL